MVLLPCVELVALPVGVTVAGNRGPADPSRTVRAHIAQFAKGEVVLKNIFVGNLSFSTTEDELRSLFASYGTVERVSILTDRDTGRSRGFGFVEMTNDAEADAAINGLNGRDIGGRKLNVNEARPKGDRSGGGGGFRGSRGGGGGMRDSYRGAPREPRW